jgi:tetratricopeptide (TPR) repeat protein
VLSAEQEQTVFISVLSSQYSSLLLRWEISAGQFFELMLPVSFALCALLSTWVLASARRRRFNVAAVTLWTFGTFFFPLIVMPLYLIARSSSRRREKERSNEDRNDSENQANESGAPPLALRRTLPLVYLLVLLSLGALYFYMDSQSVDAHLARANQARVQGQRERVIAEYRAALALEDDAHTHNLLGQELAAARRFDEALAEFRAAARMGEMDDELSLNTGIALDQLNHTDEAKLEYERFLNGPLCKEMPHDARCTATLRRLNELIKSEPR